MKTLIIIFCVIFLMSALMFLLAFVFSVEKEPEKEVMDDWEDADLFEKEINEQLYKKNL